MKTATLELPAVLVRAIEDFSFTGKPLWRIGEGLDHVKVELTFKLNDEPTDQQARAVRDRSQPANPKRRRRRRRKQRQPAFQRQPSPRETVPPTIDISPTPPPATISYQRPAMTKTPAPALTSTIQRPPSPAKIQKQKQSRRSESVLTSSPVASQPEPMTISPEDPADLNIAFSDTSTTFDPETAPMWCDKKFTTENLDMYNFKKLFRHYDSPPECRFV